MIDEKDVDPKSLIPSSYNPRIMSIAGIERLRRHIRKLGLLKPILVQVPGNHVIDGHQILKAAIMEGLKTVRIKELRISDIAAKALNLHMNKSAELADWDDPKLADLLAEIRAKGNIDDTGFEHEEADKIAARAIEATSIERMELKPAPKMVWYLIGIPLDGFAEVQEHIAALEAKALDGKSGISIQVSRPAA